MICPIQIGIGNLGCTQPGRIRMQSVLCTDVPDGFWFVFFFLQNLTLMSQKTIFRFLHVIQILLLCAIVPYYNFCGLVQYRRIHRVRLLNESAKVPTSQRARLLDVFR